MSDVTSQLNNLNHISPDRLSELGKLNGGWGNWSRWFALQMGKASNAAQAAGDEVVLSTNKGRVSTLTGRRYWDWGEGNWLGKAQAWMTKNNYQKNWIGRQTYRLVTKVMEPFYKFAYYASTQGTGKALMKAIDGAGRRINYLFGTGGKAFIDQNLASKTPATATPDGSSTTATPNLDPTSTREKSNGIKDPPKEPKKISKGLKSIKGWGKVLALGAVALSALGLFKLGEKTHYDVKAHEFDNGLQASGRNIQDAYREKGSVIAGLVTALSTLSFGFIRKTKVLRVIAPLLTFFGGMSLWKNIKDNSRQPRRSEMRRMHHGHGYSNFNSLYNNPHHAGYTMPMDQVLSLSPHGQDAYLANQRNLLEGHVAFGQVPYKHFIGETGDYGHY